MPTLTDMRMKPLPLEEICVAAKLPPQPDKVVVRSQSLSLRTPLEGETFFSFHVEALQLDADGKQIGSQSVDADKIERSLDTTADQTVTINDPSTGEDVTISVSGVKAALAAFFSIWYQEGNDPK